MEKMACKICLEKFDHSLKRPLVLFRCGHTFCAQCVGDFIEKLCPICRCKIEDFTINWSILEETPESSYDKTKAEIEKQSSEIRSIKAMLDKLKSEKFQQNNIRVESMKNQVKSYKETLLKQINTEETRILKEIETKALQFKTEVNKLTAYGENSSAKYNLSENKLKEKDLNTLKVDLLRQKADLSAKLGKTKLLKDETEFPVIFSLNIKMV